MKSTEVLENGVRFLWGTGDPSVRTYGLGSLSVKVGSCGKSKDGWEVREVLLTNASHFWNFRVMRPHVQGEDGCLEAVRTVLEGLLMALENQEGFLLVYPGRFPEDQREYGLEMTRLIVKGAPCFRVEIRPALRRLNGMRRKGPKEWYPSVRTVPLA